VAKQLALKQRLHHSRAVQHNIPAGCYRAEVVDRAGG
jgi:hypothetical protein